MGKRPLASIDRAARACAAVFCNMCTVLNVLLLVSFQILICRPQQLWTHSNQLPKDFALTCLQRGKCVTMDMEKLVKLGKEMDLSADREWK